MDGIGTDAEKKEVFRLTEMVVESVDMVDRAANKKKFLLVKREAGMADEGAVEVIETRDGHVTSVNVSDPEAGNAPVVKAEGEVACPKCEHAEKADPDTTEQKCPKCGEVMKAKEEKAGEEEEMDADGNPKKKPKKDGEGEETGKDDVVKQIPKPVQEAVSVALREGTERLMSVVSVLRSATVTEEESNAPLPNEVAGELKGIHTLLQTVLQRYPSPAAKGTVAKAASAHQTLMDEKFTAIGNLAKEITEQSGTMETDELRAKLDTLADLTWGIRGEINVVNATIEKRDDGVAASPACEDVIRAFLSKAGTLSMPGPVRDAAVTSLRGTIEKLMSLLNKVKGMETTDEESDNPLPEAVGEAIKVLSGEIGSILEKYPSPSAKSDSILAKLEAHLNGIKEIVSAALGGGVKPAAAEADKAGEEEDGAGAGGEEDPDKKKKKPGDPESGEGEGGDVEKRVATLEKSIKEKDKEIERLGGTVSGSNAADADGGDTDVNKNNAVAWPTDLAEKVQKDAAGAKK